MTGWALHWAEPVSQAQACPLSLEKHILKTLSECKAAGIPVYVFGSPELDAMHEASRDPARVVGQRGEGWYMGGDGGWHPRRTYPVKEQRYGWHANGRQYVVDHGGCFTLNTLHVGQVCPEMQDILPH